LKLQGKKVILAIFFMSVVGCLGDSLGWIAAAFAAVAPEDGRSVLWILHGRTRDKKILIELKEFNVWN
jgi:hypothetical protein